MSDTIMTIIGNVVGPPKLRTTKSGHRVANFRVASTPRRFDRETNQWTDGQTLFVSVTAWRALGENVAASLHKGQQVIVTGKYGQREYEKDEMLRVSYDLEATAVGHDLNRGVSDFRPVSRSSMITAVALDDEGHPADDSDFYLDLADDEPVEAEIDLHTGEVQELAAAG